MGFGDYFFVFEVSGEVLVVIGFFVRFVCGGFFGVGLGVLREVFVFIGWLYGVFGGRYDYGGGFVDVLNDVEYVGWK